MGSSRGSKRLKYLKNLGTKAFTFFYILWYNINNKRKGTQKNEAGTLQNVCRTRKNGT